MLKRQRHNVSHGMVHEPVGAGASLSSAILGADQGLSYYKMPSNLRGAKQPMKGWAKRVLWPSVDYDNYLKEGWEGSGYFVYIPSLGMVETFVIKEDS